MQVYYKRMVSIELWECLFKQITLTNLWRSFTSKNTTIDLYRWYATEIVRIPAVASRNQRCDIIPAVSGTTYPWYGRLSRSINIMSAIGELLLQPRFHPSQIIS